MIGTVDRQRAMAQEQRRALRELHGLTLLHRYQLDDGHVVMVHLWVIAPRHARDFGDATEYTVLVVPFVDPAGDTPMHHFSGRLVPGDHATFCKQQDGLAVRKGGSFYRISGFVVVGVKNAAKRGKWFADHVYTVAIGVVSLSAS